MITKPRIPEWYVPDPPVFLVAGGMKPEDLQTLWVLWACACQAIQEGAEPIWLLSDVIRLLAERLKIHRSAAYRRVGRLLSMRWKGKRLLVLAGLADEVSPGAGGSEAGLADEVSAKDRGPNLLMLGEAFEADLARIRRRVARVRQSHTCDPPMIKEVPPGGGGYIHDPGPEDLPPPPPNFHNVASVRQQSHGCDSSRTDATDVASAKHASHTRNAILTMGTAIGIVRRAGMAALIESGLGPRALWRLWVRVRDSGGGPGALVATLAEAGEEAGRLVPKDGPPPPVDPCPACGADLSRFGGWDRHDVCPACGIRVRECPACGELAPAEAACPWCGADPPPPPPDHGEREPAPVWPEEIRPLAEALAEALGSGPDPGWARDLEAMLRMGVTPEHIRAAASRLRERGIPIGLLAVARMALDLASTRKEDSG